MDQSDSTRATAPPRRFQFRLSYLVYLLTIAALGFAGLRRVFEMNGGWQVTAALSAVIAFLGAYFAFRFPILVARLRRRNRAIAARHEELQRWAAARRARLEDSEKDSSE